MIVLVALIVIGSILFGDELTSGPSQIALLGGALTGALIAMSKLGISWEKLEAGIATTGTSCSMKASQISMFNFLTAF